ncbi:uncharacterized protein LOC116352096 [Contarinia nasturtii]|uniref:uncharacterized protein LOC116352096 n=1 Tax=Contarinia nasturtii TaxID=265458 RepID=UPI0012D4A2A4|nr:uncharacterized protein LOC116352096 [Contarinia nasturtii]
MVARQMSFELKVKGICFFFCSLENFHLKKAKKMSFANKVILITGASSGIGADAAVHLAKKGASIAMVGRNQENLNSVSDKIKSFGAPNPLIIVADVTTGERIIEETVTHFGRLDVFINNTGIVAPYSIQTIKLHEFDRIINVNVRSAIHLSQLAVLHLAKSKGNILNVSSVYSTVAKANTLAYCISKAAMDQMTKCAALYLASKGIRVNAINPAHIRIPIVETGFGMTPQQVKKYFGSMEKLAPLGRIGNCSGGFASHWSTFDC